MYNTTYKTVFQSMPKTLLEDWDDQNMRLIINPREVQRIEKRRVSEDSNELEDFEVTVIEANVLLIPKPCTYESVIEALVRTKYTVSDELGVLRQRDTKPDEFLEYNEFVEDCKNIAKSLYIRC